MADNSNKLDDLGENARKTTDEYIEKQKEKLEEQKEENESSD